VWGIGLPRHSSRSTTYTAPFARVLKSGCVTFHRFVAIWQELNGRCVIGRTAPHDNYFSIQKFKTFTPASFDQAFVLRSLQNIENACVKARRHHLAAQRVVVSTPQTFGTSAGSGLTGPTYLTIFSRPFDAFGRSSQPARRIVPPRSFTELTRPAWPARSLW
jgi:hypothetical protein